MGKYKLVLSVSVLLVGIIIVGFFIQKQKSTKIQQQLNQDFSFDIVNILNEVYRIRDIKNAGDNNEFVQAYSTRERFLSAKNILEKWKTDKDSKRKEITKTVSAGIDNLLIASDAYINVIKNTNPKENVALFKVKLEEGRKDLYVGAAGLVLQDGGVILTKNQKQDVINFINSTFKEELEKYEKSQEKDDDSVQPQEVWAAIIIRNGLSK